MTWQITLKWYCRSQMKPSLDKPNSTGTIHLLLSFSFPFSSSCRLPIQLQMPPLITNDNRTATYIILLLLPFLLTPLWKPQRDFTDYLVVAFLLVCPLLFFYFALTSFFLMFKFPLLRIVCKLRYYSGLNCFKSNSTNIQQDGCKARTYSPSIFFFQSTVLK
jgi:hypothetical protein